MRGFKPLTLKEIKKRHTKNSQDKKLHEAIEKGKVSKKLFNKLIEKGAKKIPFDKSKSQ